MPARDGWAHAASAWVGTRVCVPGLGLAQALAGAGAQPLCRVSRCRRKQQSMEAEEARQRLKEQSIFVSAAAGVGLGSEPELPPGITPRVRVPRVSWGQGG